MGDLIPLFGESVPRSDRNRKKPLEDKTIDELLSEDLRHSITDVQYHIEQLFEARSVAEFLEGVRYIKGEMRRWPSG